MNQNQSEKLLAVSGEVTAFIIEHQQVFCRGVYLEPDPSIDPK